MNNSPIHGVWVCHNGDWQLVQVDSAIPCLLESGPVFMLEQGENENKQGKQAAGLWAAYIEKACAKLHGCYSALLDYTVPTALRDLTGAPTETFPCENDGKLWEMIQENLAKGFVVGAISRPNT